MGVFLAGCVGDEFAKAVDTALASINGKFLGDAMDRMKPSRALLDRKAIPRIGIVPEARSGFATRKSVQAVRTVHPVRTPEDQGNAARTGVFENVDGAESVIHNVEERIRITSNDRGLRAGIANQLNLCRKIAEVFRIAHVAMEKSYTVAREDRDISFAPTANEIVHDRNLVSRVAEMKDDVETDKTATTGDNDVQETILLQGLYGAELAVPFLQRRKSR